MGQLWSAIADLFDSTSEMKILMVGLDAAGKTTILYKMHLGETVTTVPTIGFNVETVRFGKNALTMWDIGGQDKLRALWRHYYANNDAILFVVDSTDRERMELARAELHKLMTTDELRTSVLLVYANKQDMASADSAANITDALRLREYTGRVWMVQGCSGVTGDGLFDGLQWVTREVRANRERLSRTRRF